MNFRFGLISLLVALVFAVAQVNSEEAEAGINKRSAEPINAQAQALIDEIKKRMGRDADPSKKLLDMIRAQRKGKRSPEADPGMMSALMGMLSKVGLGKRSAEPIDAKAQALIDEIKKRLGRAADPGKVSMAQLLEMIKANKKKGKRSPNPDPGMITAILKTIPGLNLFVKRSAEPMNIARERRNPDPSILDVITDGVNAAMNAMG
ncbi:uncharacterized protein [Venturia canescens]|uniref:uncharacterized protein isoform X3 n=1 Tax=Venturia canescens TaxID=32260 RepID=UPI001C9D2A5F|nr:uncharacterized protein LOC122415920 isoform X3 [Venturia canescens]XP_043284456.1 uncharacterized protein LOC122415920 isoform X4 [Venturia canescens]